MKAGVSENHMKNISLGTAAPARIRRTVNGVLLLDKPVGMTSNQVLQTLKTIFNARKAGHTGSLDPLASGLLPICFGEATKISGFLLSADKEYDVVCRLGARTDTGDAEGRILETSPVPELERHKIQKVFNRFHGDITQIPPMYSAIKHQGQRLYDLARDGIVVQREPRKIVIHALELSGYATDSLAFTVRCSKGTYIRTLAEDIARELGCLAYVSELRRISVGVYRSMHSLDEVRHLSQIGFSALDDLLMPIDSALNDWPKVQLGADAVWYFLRGQAVMAPGAPADGRVCVYGNGRFLGIAEVLPDGRITPRRLLDTG